MGPHYQRFFRMIKKGLYFHVGHKPLYKSYGYVGNVAHQYLKLLEAPIDRIHRQTFYLADYQPLSLREWANSLQREMGAKPIKTCPVTMAKIAAKAGDLVNICGFKSVPFNSFRLKNVLTEYQFDLSKTQKVCGPLPFDMEEGVKETVRWLVADNIIAQ